MADGGVGARLWFGDSWRARVARTALAPVAALYAAASAARGALFDAGVRRAHRGPIPVVSVGNLTVGGTGKTPVAAWIARELAARGERPAIVLRGYGGDEPLVHAALNPDVSVVVEPDRVAGVARAASAGATVAVLDDAFQHRRLARDVDLVLVSADRWPDRPRSLPVGPFREPPSALRRASLVIITRKAATDADVARVRAAAAVAAPAVPVAVVRLDLGALRAAGAERSLATLRGARILAISAVGDPAALGAQLERAGAVVRSRAFADHHAYSSAETTTLAAALRTDELPVCTLKDYVKLAALWPRQAPALWYVSQDAVMEEGRAMLDTLLTAAIPRRAAHP